MQSAGDREHHRPCTGTIYLGQMHEPIKDTKNPQSKLNAGIPFTETPKAVVFDYKMETPGTDHRIKATGFSKIVDVPDGIPPKYM